MNTSNLTASGSVMKNGLCGLALLILFGGCGDSESGFYTEAPELLEPVPVGDAFVIVDEARNEMYRVTPAGGGFDVVVETLEGAVVRRQAAPDGGLDLLLAEPPGYVHVPADGGAARTWELPAGYDRLEVREDGRFVVFAYDQFSSGTGDQVLFNPNQLTVLDRGAGDGGELRTFALTGGRPFDFWFAPELTLTDPGVPLHLVAISTQGYVSLVDLTTEDAADRQRRIPLVDPSSAASVRASSVQFGMESPDDPFDATMYVTSASVRDLYAVDLLPADPSTGRTLQPAINQIAIGREIASLHSFVLEGEERFLVLTPGGATDGAHVVDPASGTAEAVALDVSMSDAIVWDQAVDGAVRPQAFLYAPGRAIAFFVDLASFERQGMGAVRAVQLGGAVESVAVLGEGDALRALVRYQSGRGLEVVDLIERSLVPIPATVGLGEVEVSGGLVFAVSPGVERLLGVDLATQSPFEVEMTLGGTSVRASADGTLLLVEHQDPFGSYSLFDAGRLGDGPVAELTSLAWTDVLTRAEAHR